MKYYSKENIDELCSIVGKILEEYSDKSQIIHEDTFGNKKIATDKTSLETDELPSKGIYVSKLNVPSYDFREWSDPIYQCSECGGGMCKNLQMECASLPPQYIYRCNKCGHTDYLPS